jgi:hypothetical protein
VTPAELREASEAEVRGYRELLDAYVETATVLADADADPSRLLGAGARAETALEALRDLGARLGPERLSGAPVSDDVRALWREAGTLATRAALANARLIEHATACRAAVAGRLAALGAGRRALAAYRPVAPDVAPGERV